MAEFKVGDHVSWKFGGATAHGTVRKVHKRDFEMYGKTHHCSDDEPQYELESDNGGDPVIHKAGALSRD